MSKFDIRINDPKLADFTGVDIGKGGRHVDLVSDDPNCLIKIAGSVYQSRIKLNGFIPKRIVALCTDDYIAVTRNTIPYTDQMKKRLVLIKMGDSFTIKTDHIWTKA